jgi:hypothetical protein
LACHGTENETGHGPDEKTNCEAPSTSGGDPDRQAGTCTDGDPDPREHVNDRVSGCAMIGHVNQYHDRAALLTGPLDPLWENTFGAVQSGEPSLRAVRCCRDGA